MIDHRAAARTPSSPRRPGSQAESRQRGRSFKTPARRRSIHGDWRALLDLRVEPSISDSKRDSARHIADGTRSSARNLRPGVVEVIETAADDPLSHERRDEGVRLLSDTAGGRDHRRCGAGRGNDFRPPPPVCWLHPGDPPPLRTPAPLLAQPASARRRPPLRRNIARAWSPMSKMHQISETPDREFTICRSAFLVVQPRLQVCVTLRRGSLARSSRSAARVSRVLLGLMHPLTVLLAELVHADVQGVALDAGGVPPASVTNSCHSLVPDPDQSMTIAHEHAVLGREWRVSQGALFRLLGDGVVVVAVDAARSEDAALCPAQLVERADRAKPRFADSRRSNRNGHPRRRGTSASSSRIRPKHFVSRAGLFRLPLHPATLAPVDRDDDGANDAARCRCIRRDGERRRECLAIGSSLHCFFAARMLPSREPRRGASRSSWRVSSTARVAGDRLRLDLIRGVALRLLGASAPAHDHAFRIEVDDGLGGEILANHYQVPRCEGAHRSSAHSDERPIEADDNGNRHAHRKRRARHAPDGRRPAQPNPRPVQSLPTTTPRSGPPQESSKSSDRAGPAPVRSTRGAYSDAMKGKTHAATKHHERSGYEPRIRPRGSVYWA